MQIPPISDIHGMYSMIEILAVVALVIVFFVVRSSKSKRPSKTPRRRTPEQVATQQQVDIQGQPFGSKPLMNKSEYKLYCALTDFLYQRYPRYRVFPQVAMGAYLSNRDRAAYMAVNSKRSDFMIINGRGMPVAVVEFQGAGHYQGNYRQRDAIKRQAVTSAGIAFVELTATDDVHLVAQALEEQQSVV